jgi:hypothetical protein
MSRDKRLNDAGNGILKGYYASPLSVSYELTIIEHWYDPSEGHYPDRAFVEGWLL